MTVQEAWDKLEETGRGFRIERIAPTTYLNDCVTCPDPRETAQKTLGFSSSNRGRIYRCRVGRNRWSYGASVGEAVSRALALVPVDD